MCSAAVVEGVGASTQAVLPGLSVLGQREADPAGHYSELSLLVLQPNYKCCAKPGVGCGPSADSALKDCPARLAPFGALGSWAFRSLPWRQKVTPRNLESSPDHHAWSCQSLPHSFGYLRTCFGPRWRSQEVREAVASWHPRPGFRGARTSPCLLLPSCTRWAHSSAGPSPIPSLITTSELAH